MAALWALDHLHAVSRGGAIVTHFGVPSSHLVHDVGGYRIDFEISFLCWCCTVTTGSDLSARAVRRGEWVTAVGGRHPGAHLATVNVASKPCVKLPSHAFGCTVALAAPSRCRTLLMLDDRELTLRRTVGMT